MQKIVCHAFAGDHLHGDCRHCFLLAEALYISSRHRREWIGYDLLVVLQERDAEEENGKCRSSYPFDTVFHAQLCKFLDLIFSHLPSEIQATEDSAGKHGFGVYAGAVLITVWLVALVITLIVRRASKNPSMLLQVLTSHFSTSRGFDSIACQVFCSMK